MTRVFTTGQVARIFSVNINTVIKWFDDGKLKGFRLPRSNERRIYRESVLEFMTEHDISQDLLRVFDEEQVTRKRGRGGARNTEPPRPTGGAENRNFPRKPVDLVARLFINETPTDVTVRNLSMGGVYLTGFSSNDKLIPEEFKLVMAVEGERTLDGVCQLVHLHRGDDQTMAFGCRFTQVDPGSLQSYLANI